MSEVKIYEEIKSHYDPDENPFTENATGSGIDIHRFSITDGQVYSRPNLEILTDTMGSSCRIISEPRHESSGRQQIKVKWNYNLMGKIRYKLSVFTVGEGEGHARSCIMIKIGEYDWEKKAIRAIDDGRCIKLVLSGIEVSALARVWNLKPGLSKAVGVDDIGILMLAALAVVCVLIGFVLMYAISKGCNAKVKHHIGGPLPFDDKLEFDIQCRDY